MCKAGCFLHLLCIIAAVIGCNTLCTAFRQPFTRIFPHSSLQQRHSGIISRQSTRDSPQISSILAKNVVLLEKLLNPEPKTLEETVAENINFCDEGFNQYLNSKIDTAESEEHKSKLGSIRYELNIARQRKLMQADSLLRSILAAGGLKQMEAQVKQLLRRGEIDMAFLVILQLNIEDAQAAQAEGAVQ
eukprot:gene34392-41625_t